jgi:hypothetical protein
VSCPNPQMLLVLARGLLVDRDPDHAKTAAQGRDPALGRCQGGSQRLLRRGLCLSLLTVSVWRPSGLCGPADGQPLDAALEARPQARGLARVPERGRAGQDRLEQRAHLGAGEMSVQAEVRAVAEGQVGLGWGRMSKRQSGCRPVLEGRGPELEASADSGRTRPLLA